MYIYVYMLYILYIYTLWVYTYNVYIYIHIYIYIYIQHINIYNRAALMSLWKDKTHVSGYIRSGFIHRAVWTTLMRTEYFLFLHHTTSVLAKLSTLSFEHPGNISCSVLINPNHTDESWEGRNTCLYVLTQYILYILVLVMIIYIIIYLYI